MKKLLKMIGILAVGFFSLIGIGTTVLFIGFMLIVGQVSSHRIDKTAAVEPKDIEKSFLSLELDGPITTVMENPRDQLFSELFGGPSSMQLMDIENAVRRATEDIRVHGIYVDIKNPSASLTTIIALRRSLMKFKDSGKPLWINLNTADMGSYLLASVGSQINLSPLGEAMIPGPAFQLTYFGSALEKLGLEVEVFRAGKYKSAMEAFVKDEPSDASLEMYGSLEESIRLSLIEMISQGRGRTPQEVRNWLKRSNFTSQESLERGLVDKVGYREPFLEDFKELVESSNDVSVAEYLASSTGIDEPRIYEGEETIGYLEAIGQIQMKADPNETVIAPDPVIKELQWLAKKEDVKAVVFRIDSPGGSALASDMIWEEVRKLAELKPVVVSMGSVAASGGYYIAAPATKIFAEAETITGSIGVIGASFNGKSFSDKYGVSFHMVTQSDRRDFLNFGEEASDEDKEIISTTIDNVYNTFISKVGQGRSKTPDQVHDMAQGRVWSGAEALELGLVDFLGGRLEAFRMAKKLAELNPEKIYRVSRYKPKPKSILDCVGSREEMFKCLQELESKITLNLRLNLGVPTELVTPLENLKKLIEDDQTLMYWPGQLKLVK